MVQHNPELIAALKQSHLFSSLTDLQLERVCRHARIVRLNEGQLLFAQGEDVDCFYLVLSGRIKLFRVSVEGQEKIIEIVPQGGVFAEALMFMDQPNYPVSAAALLATVVAGIDARDFKAMLKTKVSGDNPPSSAKGHDCNLVSFWQRQ